MKSEPKKYTIHICMHKVVGFGSFLFWKLFEKNKNIARCLNHPTDLATALNSVHIEVDTTYLKYYSFKPKAPVNKTVRIGREGKEKYERIFIHCLKYHFMHLEIRMQEIEQ